MAIKFFDCKGFGQIEPNQVWFTRAGMVEAQCALDSKKFASKFPMTPEEAKANKIEIKDAVEKLFNVKVESVNTINVRPKKKRVGRYPGKTNKVKKAIVTLKEGSSIELN